MNLSRRLVTSQSRKERHHIKIPPAMSPNLAIDVTKSPWSRKIRPQPPTTETKTTTTANATVMACEKQSRDSTFDAYTRQLTLYDDFLAILERDVGHCCFQAVEYADLTTESSLPGKNKARVVRGAPIPPHRHVFKGFDLDAFLGHGAHFKEHQRDTMLHEIRTLAILPAHPNIMPCPQMLVVVRDGDGRARVCGFLQPVMERETLDDQVKKANLAGRRISLSRKARWCRGLAQAVLHTHRVGRTYHMDVKPGNTLVDDADEVRLIDWEQSGVSMFTHSKEVTVDQGAVEADELAESGKPKIVYTRYQGPEPRRANLPWGYPEWNVFPVWQMTCPRAAELAEVFSLGRVYWMLLEQVEQSREPTKWTEASCDIPLSWIDVVMRCQREDPNDRPDLDEIIAFWQCEETTYQE